MPFKPLLRTVHGSHLYGLAREDSDLDVYEVVPDNYTDRLRYAKQTIVDGVDTFQVDLSTWLHYCEIGVPQACEAMFSQKADIDLIRGLRASFRLTSQSWSTYLRVMKSFALHEGHDRFALKRRRHALRLAFNLRDIRAKGWFNPTLDSTTARNITQAAFGKTNDPETIYAAALQIAGF